MITPKNYREYNKFTLRHESSAWTAIKDTFEEALDQLGFGCLPDLSTGISSVMLNDFSLSFKRDSNQIIDMSALNKASGLAMLFGHSLNFDIPKMYGNTQISDITWTVDTVFSIYDEIDVDPTTEGTQYFYEAVQQTLMAKLAYLLALILPYRNSNVSQELQSSITAAANAVNAFIGNLSSESSSSTWESLTDLITTASSFINGTIAAVTQSQGTKNVFDGIFDNIARLSVPVQLHHMNDRYNSGLVFIYGPVKLYNVFIDSINITMGKMIMQVDGIAYPEYIKVSLNLSTQYTPSLNMFSEWFTYNAYAK